MKIFALLLLSIAAFAQAPVTEAPMQATATGQIWMFSHLPAPNTAMACVNVTVTPNTLLRAGTDYVWLGGNSIRPAVWQIIQTIRTFVQSYWAPFAVVCTFEGS